MRQNSKILETLNLPSLEEALGVKTNTEECDEVDAIFNDTINQEHLNQIVDFADNAASSLAMLEGDGHSEAMDEIHKETLQHARDLMDLGFNVDQRSAATIFEKANMLYSTSMNAKISKRDAQLKAMKLMLDKRKLELEEKKLSHLIGDKEPIAATGTVVSDDRNDIIKQMRDLIKETNVK
jgi:undecaprenyl pyrophosphate synthase